MEDVVVITGASSGIGKALYEEYKKLPGYDVIGISRRGPDIELDLIPLDFSYAMGIVRRIVERPVYMLINCAGIMPFDENKEVFDVNFWGIYIMIENLLTPGMCVVNIASVAGLIAEPELPIYAASKAAVLSLTGSLAKKYANQSIRVNSISPGFYKTNLVEGDTPDELVKMIPAGYEGDPKDLFPVVRMIEQAEYMTGSNIIIDGGLICRTI